MNCLECGSNKPLHVWTEQPRWGYCTEIDAKGSMCMAPHDMIEGKLVEADLDVVRTIGKDINWDELDGL